MDCLGRYTSRECTKHDILCTCYVDIGTCKNPSECPEGETCVRDTQVPTKVCTSCNYIRQHMSQLSSVDTKCKGAPVLPLPVYPPPPKGLYFDQCVADFMCAHPYQCRLSTGEKCPPIGENAAVCYCVAEPTRCFPDKPCRFGEA